MRIIQGDAHDAPSNKGGSRFSGQVWSNSILPTTDGVTINDVFFTAGARTFWHRHEHGQILRVLSGHGLVCTFGEEPRAIRAGDTVWVPAGEQHWHGAGPDSVMSHTAVSLGETQWLDEVDVASTDPSTQSQGE